MLYVVHVTRVSLRNARVCLSDGRTAKVPKEMAHWGVEVESSDIVEVPRSFQKDFWHIDLLKKDKASGRVLFRDYRDFDAEAEIDLVRNCIRRNYKSVFGRFWASDQLEDYTLEVFLHLWERDCFRRWDGKQSAYAGYVNVAVRNCLIDIARNVHVQQFRSSLSLNVPVGDDNGSVEWLDMLEDVANQDVLERLQAEALYQRMRARVLELDLDGTGVYGVSYKAIFDALVSDSWDDFKSASTCGGRLLDFCVTKLRNELEEVRRACAV
jgi:hypothetical protein